MPHTGTFDIRTLTDEEAHTFGLGIAGLAKQLAEAKSELAATRAREVAAKAENIGLAKENRALHRRLDVLQTANETASHGQHFGHMKGRSDGWPGLAGEESALHPRPATQLAPAVRSGLLADLPVIRRDVEMLAARTARSAFSRWFSS